MRTSSRNSSTLSIAFSESLELPEKSLLHELMSDESIMEAMDDTEVAPTMPSPAQNIVDCIGFPC